VNEGDSLKELGSAGKQTRIFRPENDQMRDILVTSDNAGQYEMFSPAHIERMAALRKARQRRKTPGCIR
jgi:hypothetical protein